METDEIARRFRRQYGLYTSTDEVTRSLGDLVVLLADDRPDVSSFLGELAAELQKQHAAAEADQSRPAQRRLCAHADEGGKGMHWLEPGERCPLANGKEQKGDGE